MPASPRRRPAGARSARTPAPAAGRRREAPARAARRAACRCWGGVLAVADAASGGHQVQLAGPHQRVVAGGVAVLDLAAEQPAHRLQPGVRVRRHDHPAGPATRRARSGRRSTTRRSACAAAAGGCARTVIARRPPSGTSRGPRTSMPSACHALLWQEVFAVVISATGGRPAPDEGGPMTCVLPVALVVLAATVLLVAAAARPWVGGTGQPVAARRAAAADAATAGRP